MTPLSIWIGSLPQLHKSVVKEHFIKTQRVVVIEKVITVCNWATLFDITCAAAYWVSHSLLRIWSHLLRKPFMENFIFVHWYLRFNPILANSPILYPMKKPKTTGFSGVYRGYIMETLAINGLIRTKNLLDWALQCLPQVKLNIT